MPFCGVTSVLAVEDAITLPTASLALVVAAAVDTAFVSCGVVVAVVIVGMPAGSATACWCIIHSAVT
jgi:hypothetical protein